MSTVFKRVSPSDIPKEEFLKSTGSKPRVFHRSYYEQKHKVQSLYNQYLLESENLRKMLDEPVNNIFDSIEELECYILGSTGERIVTPENEQQGLIGKESKTSVFRGIVGEYIYTYIIRKEKPYWISLNGESSVVDFYCTKEFFG